MTICFQSKAQWCVPLALFTYRKLKIDFDSIWLEGGGGIIHVRDLFLKIVFENQIFHAQVRNSGTVIVLYRRI